MRVAIAAVLGIAAGAYLALTLRAHIPPLIYLALSRGDGR